MHFCKEAIRFVVDGPPVGKGRPRFRVITAKSTGRSFVNTYTPKESSSYENLVKLSYRRSYGGPPHAEGPVGVGITAFFPIPKSWPKWKKETAGSGLVRTETKPDVDNILKAILDGLNGVAYSDDKQVYLRNCDKFYSLTPRVEVILFFEYPITKP